MAETETAHDVDVFVNRRDVRLTKHEMTVAQLLVAAGFEGTGWDVFHIKGEGDPTGGEPLPSTEELHLHDGERFRVIPGHRTFGA